jgi:hypothetical protein
MAELDHLGRTADQAERERAEINETLERAERRDRRHSRLRSLATERAALELDVQLQRVHSDAIADGHDPATAIAQYAPLQERIEVLMDELQYAVPDE